MATTQDYPCSVDGCEKPSKTRGWCGAHYERWRRNGDPGPAGDARKRPPKGTCEVEGCDRPAKSRNWCSAHYQRWREHGDPETMVRPNYGTGRRLHEAGYIMIWEPTHPLAMSYGYVFEHRKVLHDAGIVVPDGCHVHHKNEDKTDNRLANLEVLTPAEHTRHHLEETGTVTNQYGTFVLGTGKGARWSAVREELGQRFCPRCGSDMTERRTDAKFCSSSCRVAAFKEARTTGKRL